MSATKIIVQKTADQQAEETADKICRTLLYGLVGAVIIIPAVIFVGGLLLLGAPIWVGVLAYLFLFVKK